MKNLWTAIAWLALLNLLAIIGGVAFLGATGRLDARRLREVAAAFEETIPQREAREKAEAEGAAQDAKAAAEEARRTSPPISAERSLSERTDAAAQELQRVRRTKDEVALLRTALEHEKELFSKARAEWESERTRVDEERKERETLEASEQFRKSVKLLESQKPADARLVLKAILEGQPPPLPIETGLAANAPAKADRAPSAAAPPADGKRLRVVVAYLNAMQDRARGRVMAEFVKEDPVLAAELLERLRTRGLTARASEEALR